MTACWLTPPLLISCLMLLFTIVVGILCTPAAVKMADGGLPPVIAAGVPNGAVDTVTVGWNVAVVPFPTVLTGDVNIRFTVPPSVVK